MPILFREIFWFESFENKIAIEKFKIYGEPPEPPGDLHQGETRTTLGASAFEPPLCGWMNSNACSMQFLFDFVL